MGPSWSEGPLEAWFQHAAQRLADNVVGDEGGDIDGAFPLAAAAGLWGLHEGRSGVSAERRHLSKAQSAALCRDAATNQAQAQPFKVGDGLLKDVAEDIDVNDRADFGVLVRVSHLARGRVIVIAKVLEIGADPVRDPEAVQTLIQGEEAAVVGGDVRAGVAFAMARKRPPKLSQAGFGL